jgi:hypothetical protein
MKMFEKENHTISYALNMWANYIETGDVTVSAQTAQKLKEPFNSLTEDQMEFIVKLRKMSTKYLTRGE